ncbi:MAG TPA: GMC family oxidoreductase N-terminal domain-containing protein [Thermomicrobiales bacterium]|nr:GMC family oxidoreductase N-terminal domain-containing protein [Thermomicrobiales bacterium]
MAGASLPRYADFVVVGAGPGGCAAAAELARSGSASVLVLEAGPDYGPHDSGRWPAELLEAFDLAETHGWGYDSASSYGSRVVSFSRARVVGGCSAHNGCAAIWGHRLDYDGWAAAGNDGWSTDVLLPFFREANEAMRVAIPGPAHITPFHQLMLESAAAAGIPLVADLNDLDEPIGMAPSPANIWNGIRWNAAFAFLDPIRNQANVRIIGDALVDTIQFHDGRVAGVTVVRDGTREFVGAGTVALAGGTYNSPAVLLRSGVGPADQLHALGIDVVADLPGVGQNLHDHPAVYLVHAGSETLKGQMASWAETHFLPEEQTIAKLRSSRCSEAFDLHIYPESGPYAEGRTTWDFTIPVACMTPKARGALRIRSTDPTVPPVLDHNYLGDPDGHDQAVLVEGIGIAREIARNANRYGLLGEELEPGPSIAGDHAVAGWVSDNVHHYFHAAGTCAMGPDNDRAAVVTQRGAVRDVEGLFVADCSVMPVVPRANTNIPAVVVGMRIGRWLAGTDTHQ